MPAVSQPAEAESRVHGGSWSCILRYGFGPCMFAIKTLVQTYFPLMVADRNETQSPVVTSQERQLTILDDLAHVHELAAAVCLP